MAQLISVKLSRFDGSPWGFRLQGGKDFGTPLIVQKVNGGSPAEQAGLRAGDAVIRVNSTDMFNLRHKDAQDVIVRSGNSFEVTVQRGGSTWRPSVSPVSATLPSPQPSAPASCVSPVTKTSLAAKKQDTPLIGSGHNFTPKPFLNGSSEGPIKSIVNKQYNSPVGIYSEETIAETLSAQAEVLAGGVLGVNFKKNERNYNAENSEVFKMVQEADKEPKTPEPAEPAPHSGVITPSSPALAGLRSVTAPETKPQPTTPQSSLPPGQNICADCERLIVGVFVRIKDKNLHVECFKCSTCGTSLKNVGYYNINNKLYCDIHAKLVARQNAPSGFTPVTVPPGGKAPAGTISAALTNLGGGAPMSPPLNSHGSPQPFASHTANNIGGPKPFGGSSIIAPSNFAPAPVQNSGSNTLPRPQSQTVTATPSFNPKPRPFSLTLAYYEDSDYYESIEAPMNESGPLCVEEHYSQHREVSASAKSKKSLVWPPVKPIEDITYPTASPIWIDPNPVLDRRPRHNVREKRATLQEASDSRCGSRCGSRCSRYEERDYEGYSITSSSSRLNNYRETSMDRASCSQPFYRKVEVSETRRECRGSAPPPRASSAESVRRSLTPTRISQPMPKPWVATVTAGTSFYDHVEPPPQPEPETVCTRTCRCQIICERTSGPQGPEHEQQHTYRAVSCELCRPTARPPPPPQQVCKYSAPEEAERPQDMSRESENEVVDLSKVVPPDVAVCPKGVEGQHNLFTETMEKDVGDIHIKKTTIYEKTVEVLSPDRARSPEAEERPATESIEPCRMTSEQETCQRSSVTLDREVETISDRRTTVESSEVLTSAISTAQLMEEARKEEEAKRAEYERVCREEEERLRREEQECQEQQRRYEEEKSRRKERKRVAFGGQQTCVQVQESHRPQECYQREEYVREEEPSQEPIAPSEERYRELKEEIKIQEDFNHLEEQRRQSLREQVEVHQCMREQQQQQTEKRQSLQERRLCARFRDTTAERQVHEQQYQQQYQSCQQQQQSAAPPVHQSSDTCQKKHVQFMTQTETGTRPLPPTTIKNATAKEWKSEMVRALTTAPARPYSPLDSAPSQQAEDGESTSRTVYSREVRYEEKRAPCPPPPAPQPRYQPTERPVSPFQDALMTAPERPYTPLGRESGEGYDSIICVNRSQTPVDWTTNEGYCHPAEILYTDDKTREARSRERNLKRVEGPRPLPTPPPDHRLRDTSVSPARSLSRPGTPKDRSLMTGLKKPGTIPSYQRYLVSMQHDAVEAQPYVQSRTPTPNRTKSPAPGPPEPPACYVKAHAPRIRESPPPCKRTSSYQQQQTSSYSSSMPEHCENVSYHLEEDSPSGHRAQAYHGVRRSYYSDDSRSDEVERVCERQTSAKYERREEQSSVALQPQREHEDAPSCAIGKVNRMQPSLACPMAHCSGSERFPKTGVRVLPPCAPPVSCAQSYETRRVCHQERTTTASGGCSSSSAFASQQFAASNCPNSGVTIMPCKTTSQSGTKAGIVIVPCNDDDNPSCSRAGICVTPTSDRSGVCVSPIAHGKSTTNCSKSSGGPRSGGSTIDIGNCPASGVRVAACGDGSISVAPCSIPGYAPVKCPKPILKSPCPRAEFPYPQIPLPNETDESATDPCETCPLKNQTACQPEPSFSSCTIKEQSFQPIPERRTNLSNQLTQLTIKRDKQQVVQLFKPQAQSQSRCLITDTVCQTKTQYSGSQNPGPNCKTQRNVDPPNLSSQPDLGSGIGAPGAGGRAGKFAGSTAPKRGRGILNQAGGPGSRQPLCGHCSSYVRGPFITALGQIWCPEHFVCVNSQCRRALQDIGFVEEKGQLHCEYCFERFIAPGCNKCNNKIKGDCLNAVGKHFHPECFNCSYCGKLFGNSPFFLEDGLPYCEADWNELFTTKCYACGFPVEAGDRWVEALNNNYHSQCFNCTMCKKNLEGQSFYAKGGRPFCKNHAR